MFLIHLWTFLVGLVIILYVLLDGFVLGVGILFPFARSEEQRNIMIGTIGPVWDANQTWIVFGGGALFATFPMIYTVLFSAFYIPLLTFLFGLIFRGVAFEFRANSTHKTAWNRAFFSGSVVAAFAQGVTLGAYLTGIKTEAGMFAGGAFDWLHPFSVMVGLALVAGYALLGAAYLVIKTGAEVQRRAYRQAIWAALIVTACMVLVSIWTPLHTPAIAERWVSAPRIYFIWIFPVIWIGAFAALMTSLRRKDNQFLPFVFAVVLFIAAYLWLQAGIYPYAVLPDITIFEAAAQRQTQIVTLIGALLILPFVLGYTFYSYWVFRGKVTEGIDYH